MFDTMKVARKIKEARIARNMTQMNLADAMEVSYQAVSNWERGSSCPDIGKLEQLCQILEIGVDELLGTDSASRTLSRITEKEEVPEADAKPVTIEEIQEVAPLLPPADMARLVDDSLDNQEDGEPLDLKAIAGLAPFLDEKYLDALLKRAQVHSLKDLAGLAPFLSSETLDVLVAEADIKGDISGIISLAPFLGSEALGALVENADPQKDMSHIVALAPFLGEEALAKILEKLPDDAHVNISGLYPFLSQNTLQKMAESLMRGGDLHALKSLAPFL